ncbi:hypothetical protein CRYUN_Cryun22dG0043300 [Craigia yunnanensis]
MSNPQAPSNGGDKHCDDSMEAAVAKTAGFVVFSGIAISILKTLNPFNKDRNATPLPEQQSSESTQSSLTQPIRDSPPPAPAPRPEPIITKVSIDAIKEANGLTGDTIYAGKKLIIP